ncbi:MAG: hypothetical protein EDM05_025900 [Leptolyngbya sp. IPPAS B-1204]
MNYLKGVTVQSLAEEAPVCSNNYADNHADNCADNYANNLHQHQHFRE